MLPPSNRPRSASNASNDEVEEANKSPVLDGNPILLAKPHDELWYKDGNIVLATDVHLYKLHKGILANCSTVFRDMFDSLREEGDESGDSAPAVCSASCSEKWENVPLVKMVGDRDDDVYHFLMFFYKRSFFRAHQPSTRTFAVFSSLVTMGAKYDVGEIRSELVEFLVDFFPTTLDAFDKEKSSEIFSDTREGQAFWLLRAAKQFLNEPTLLPSLYYACASQPLWTIFSLSHLLDRHDVEIIIVGREKMLRYSHRVATALFHPYADGHLRCSSDCLNAKASILQAYPDSNSDSSWHPPFPLEIAIDGALAVNPDTSTNVCYSCNMNYRSSIKAIREMLWRDLPYIFQLGSWEELLN
ncbi:hypothetical protein SCHPADRAFT_947612 [Schizopora paradoxa]|uniref:BTB domain-containing protein n=1 Tax=Schizopora paradoxa TaxID=27342 RepID=A0A0H2R509_9AGAM|nr:hypothetical protein SCHPADRAFT_947612 [Schizopora paradoxa]